MSHCTLQHHVTVALPREAAFRLFTEDLGSWWPTAYTWSRDALEEIGIESGEDGLCSEHGPHGFRVDWGRVLAWEPPGKLVLAWQISPQRVPQPDPDHASTLEVRFEALDTGDTRVVLEHRDFERHGEGADEYCKAMASDKGWPYILGRYAEAAMR